MANFFSGETRAQGNTELEAIETGKGVGVKRRRATTLGLAFCALVVTAARTTGARGVLRTAATGLTATALMVKDEWRATTARTLEAAQDFGAEVSFRRTGQMADPAVERDRLAAEASAIPSVTDVNDGQCKTGA